ncbi:MAG: type II toxin-antitoxin system VapC family toxin [Geminicoccaceae bacterium]|nr:MAG: type II toxin-antitoxin system VapC family toxin [Geminicoccaceae bacterium]
MVLDTSVLVAIACGEPETGDFLDALATNEPRLLSAANFVEAGIVLEARFGAAGGDWLRDFVAETGVDVIPVTVEQARAAVGAFRQYGKGRHPAALNFGDCFAYALAQTAGEALLFKRDDFARTDVRAVAYG